MTHVAGEIDVLEGYAKRLDELSKAQTDLLSQLEPIEARYEQGLASHERETWLSHVQNGKQFPSERVRLAFYQVELDRDFLDTYVTLKAQSRRIEKQISHLKALIDARRSILSALKLESEASA